VIAGGVSVRARFERFPATVKGAFVVRGEDRNPHLVVLREARVCSVHGALERPVPVGSVTVDVPPRQDVFVPFEFGVSDLEPGWYGLEADLEVDGVAETFPGGKRFSVSWPRGTMRRGGVPVGRKVKVGGISIDVEQFDMGSDHSSIRFTPSEVGKSSVEISCEGVVLVALTEEVDESAGRVKASFYPVPRSASSVSLEFRVKSEKAVVEVRLPA
jgi:hypothetical protein